MGNKITDTVIYRSDYSAEKFLLSGRLTLTIQTERRFAYGILIWTEKKMFLEGTTQSNQIYMPELENLVSQIEEIKKSYK